MSSRFKSSQGGASIVEYVIVLGVLSLSITAAISGFSSQVSSRMEVASNQIFPPELEVTYRGGGTDQLHEICYQTREEMPQDGHEYRLCPQEESSETPKEDDSPPPPRDEETPAAGTAGRVTPRR